MNKKEFVEAYAKLTGETKKRAEELVEAFLDVTKSSLAKKEDVVFIGFGTFTTMFKEKTVGRNPQTGKPIEIPAKTVVKFKAGSKLKEVVNK